MPGDALDEAQALLARAVETQRAAREAGEAFARLQLASREWLAATSRYDEAHAALWDGAPPLLPALCTELAAARGELRLLREYHEAREAAVACAFDFDAQDAALERVTAARTALAAWKGRR